MKKSDRHNQKALHEELQRKKKRKFRWFSTHLDKRFNPTNDERLTVDQEHFKYIMGRWKSGHFWALQNAKINDFSKSLTKYDSM